MVLTGLLIPFAGTSLGILGGFQGLLTQNPAVFVEIDDIFGLFRYTLTQNRAVHTEPPLFCVEDARHFRQHRTIPALRLKHRSGSCGTASALQNAR